MIRNSQIEEFVVKTSREHFAMPEDHLIAKVLSKCIKDRISCGDISELVDILVREEKLLRVTLNHPTKSHKAKSFILPFGSVIVIEGQLLKNA